MKISFEPLTQKTERSRTTDYRNNVGQNTASKSFPAYWVDNRQGGTDIWQQDKKKGKTAYDIQQEAQNTDLVALQDYMTVMSHTMSEKDYAKMQEEGFHFEQMDPEEAVTIVDKIKAEMARSGQVVVGYNDTIDIDTLAEALGSQTLAQTIAENFEEFDIPLTEANINSCMQAVTMAQNLHAPTEGECRYMVDNQMETDIWSFYMAQNSGAVQNNNTTVPKYYADDINGYYSKAAQELTPEELGEQIDHVLGRAGMELNVKNRAAANWILKQGLPLTQENLEKLNDINKMDWPITQEKAVKAAVSALADGKEAYQGNLLDSSSRYQKAVKWMEYYDNLALPAESQITARRQLEEIRLRMTVEVNVKLLESGFYIDTAPMEKLIDALRAAEQQVASKYFPNAADGVEKYQQYQKTCDILQQLPGLPASILGSFQPKIEKGSLEEFYQEGKKLQAAYEKAGQSYETFMTAPREDLGDGIEKAGASIDHILRDLGLENTEENRRIIRILGYNRMDMTLNNVEQIKKADSMVKNVIEKMTPAATLKMIRDNVNPLEQSMPQLKEYFDNLPEQYQEASESYSRFLYGLEKNQEITEKERDAYIGIYRLLHQIEGSDGAAVGAVVNLQAQLTFSNLLSAVRTAKSKHLDMKVSDELGGLTEMVQKGVAINKQIEQGYGPAWKAVLNEVSTPEGTQEELVKQNIEQIRQAAVSDQECIALLEKGDVKLTASNILAAKDLLTHPGKTLQKWNERLHRGKEAQGLWEKLSNKEDFQEEYKQVTEESIQAVESATMEEHTYMDVKELQLLHKQLNILGALAQTEEYVVPIELSGNTTYVHLTLEQGKGARGQVRIAMNLAENTAGTEEQADSVEALLWMGSKGVSGYFAGNSETAVTKLHQTADIFLNRIRKEWSVDNVQVVQGNLQNITGTSSGSQPRVSNEGLYQLAKVFLAAVQQA